MHPNSNTLNMHSEQVQDFRIRHLVGKETPDELTALVRRAMAPLSRRGEPDPFERARSSRPRLGRRFVAADRLGRRVIFAEQVFKLRLFHIITLSAAVPMLPNPVAMRA